MYTYIFFSLMAVPICTINVNDIAEGPSRTRGQNCLLMSKIRHRNEKSSVTGLFPKGQNLVTHGQTSKMPSTTSGAGQIETNLGKQKQGCFDSEMI